MNRYPDPRRSKVVLVGTSHDEHDKKLSRLPAIRNNLVGLEGAFTNPSTGVFTSENCMVVDTPDSPKSMMQRLTRAMQVVTTVDSEDSAEQLARGIVERAPCRLRSDRRPYQVALLVARVDLTMRASGS